MTQPAKSAFVRIGDFFFKFRNFLFPLALIPVFFTYSPAEEYFGSRSAETASDWVAVLLVLAGLAMRGAVIGYAYIKRGGLNKQVYADTLVTEGFFSASRNPLYVGNMLIYMGIFLMHGNVAVFLGGSLVMYGIYSSIIAAEEYFLRNKFGAQFDAYCATTPRWLPLWRRIRAATSEMEFNWKRWLVKDYSTVANSFIALVAVEGLQEWKESGQSVDSLPLAYLAIIIALILAALSISFAKKRRWLTAS